MTGVVEQNPTKSSFSKLAPIGVEILFMERSGNKKIGTESGTGLSIKPKLFASKNQPKNVNYFCGLDKIDQLTGI